MANEFRVKNGLIVNGSTTTSTGTTANANADNIVIDATGDTGLTILSGSSSTGNIFFGDGDSATQGQILYAHSGNSMRFVVAGSEKIRVNNAGRVGIGATTPLATLDVQQGGASSQFTMIGGADLGAATRTDDTRKFFRLGIPHYDNDEEPFSLITGDSDDGENKVFIGGGTSLGNTATNIFFNTGTTSTTTTGSTRMTIKSDGKIGIGDTNPIALLHLEFAAGDTTTFSNENETYRNMVLLRNNTVNTNSFAGIAFDISSESDFDSISASIAAVRDTSAGSTAANHDGNLAFSTNDGGDDGNYERMRITHDGLVGIGTNDPDYDLHVVGSGYFTDDLRVGNTSPTKITLNGNDAFVEGQFEAAGTAGSYIYSLALGTASPTGSSAGKFETSGDVQAGSITIGGHSFDDIDIGTEFVDTDDHIMSSGAIKEKIESYNYLASVDISANTNLAVSSPIILTGDTVGLDDPANLSELNESTDATDDKILLWDESASSWKYMTLDNLQDSIDTSASGGASALDGLTDVLISNDSLFINNFGGTPATGTLNSATDNIAIGKDALRVITSADHNIAIGDQAGYDITNGSKNVMIGVEAGGDTDSGIDLSVFIGQHAGLRMKGDENIAIGDNSMTGSATKADNTGTNNIAIGSPTMNAVTTGSDNVALGQLTLTALTEGNNNVAIGLNALDILTTGDDNVAIGQYALYQHTTGSDNVAIGPSAMRASKNTSSSHIAIGKSAGYYMGANGNNIGIGEFAVRGSTAPNDNLGQDNIGIGYKTLFVHTTADYNVAIGYEAATAITGGDKNVAIGYEALHDGQSNLHCVAIGTQAMDALTGGDYNIAIGESSMGDTDADLSRNIAIGREAGRYLGSNDNIALGFEALHGSTTATNNTGTSNIAIGYQAAREYTTGEHNIAVGYQAMESITTGDDNVAIGDRALDALTTGTNNIAIGPLSGSSTSTDMTGGIFLGLQAGYYMDGDYNIGIGHTAVEGSSTTGNNTGNHNVGIGYQPMMEVTSGYKNVGIGYLAGAAITTGRGNVAIGEDAGTSVTTGDFNVTIGYDAGDSLQGGDDNVLIGSNAGQNLTSGSDNLVLAAGASGDLRDATGSKQLVIRSGSDVWLEGFGGDMYFGQNTNYYIPAPTSSNDTAGSSLIFGGGAGTGTAKGGDLKLQYAPPGGSSNTTHNSYSDALKVDGETGDVTIYNNLIVSGTTTTINTATVEVEDNIIQLNTTQGSPDSATATTSGITIYRGDGVTQASFIFDDGDDTWDLTNNLVVAGNTRNLSDSNKTFFGADNDLSIFHDGSNAYIDSDTGLLRLDGNDGVWIDDGGSNIMRITNSTVLSYRGLDITGDSVHTGNLHLDADDNQLIFGAGSDLKIYHDGSNSYIDEEGTGSLIINSSQVAIKGGADAAENMATFVDNGAVTLYHNNSAKLATTATGVEVTGLMQATTKSFDIEHPTKKDMRLRYGALEGPEYGVYHRGVGSSRVVDLPDYWTGLVDEDSITVQLTPRGGFQSLYVSKIEGNRVYVDSDHGEPLDFYFNVYGERKDVDKLVVEY